MLYGYVNSHVHMFIYVDLGIIMDYAIYLFQNRHLLKICHFRFFFSPDLSNINYLKHMLAPWNDNFAAIAMVMLHKYLKSHVYTFRYIDLTPSCYCYAICLLSHDGSVYGNFNHLF